MTGKFNTEKTTKNYRPDYTQYSGEIQIEDFNTYIPNKKRINGYIDSIKFNADCCKRKEMQKKYKGMTLEELREKKFISNTDGRPLPSLTNEKWQNELAIRKLFIQPHSNTKKRFGEKFSKNYEKNIENQYDTYLGVTNYQQYCHFINDILKNIRSGQVDYCYYIYQIIDLLKFHYNDLQTRYCDGYWEVWLDKC